MYNADWAVMLNDMLPAQNCPDDVSKDIWKEIVDYVIVESDGVFCLESPYLRRLQQQKDAPWQYIFDVLKLATGFTAVVKYDMPMLAKPVKPRPHPGYVFAKYEANTGCIRLTSYTGKWRKENAGSDGYGAGDEIFEVVECAVDRSQRIVEPPAIKWL